MIKLLASDLDGTIIDSNNKINSYDLEAIDKLNSKSTVEFAVCTGKTYSMTKDICKKLNAKYGVFGNGTQILNLKTGEEIARNTISKSQAYICIDIANENNLHIHIYTEDKLIVQENFKYMAFRNFMLYRNNMEFEIVDSLKEYIENNNISIFKLVISSKNNLENIKEKILASEKLEIVHFKKYNQYIDKIINEEYEYLDIVPKNITKYTALKQLENYLKLNDSNMMTIGDNVNDIEMIENAGIGVAIGGSCSDVVNKASYVTKNNVENGGFAEAVFKFIKI